MAFVSGATIQKAAILEEIVLHRLKNPQNTDAKIPTSPVKDKAANFENRASKTAAIFGR